MSNETLRDKSTNKKMYIIIAAVIVIIFLIASSLHETYRELEDDWKKKSSLTKEEEIEISDRSMFDIDQMAAIKNEFEERESRWKKALEIDKLKAKEQSSHLLENQIIIKEQQEEILALRAISKKEQRYNDKKIEKEFNRLRNKLTDTQKKLGRLKKEKDINSKLRLIEIDLPPLNSSLMSALTEEKDNKQTKKIKIKKEGTKVNRIVEQKDIYGKKNTNDFFDFGTFKINHNEIKKLAEVKKNIEEKKNEIIPKSMDLMLGLVDATLIMGVDAPTNIGTENSAAKDPLPVLISVSSKALIANDYQQDYKNCLILATATGNATTERAYMRLSNLSCVTSDGTKRIEANIQGWVVGEDNKAGVTGNLVTKSGSLILKGLMAGIMQGISQSLNRPDTIVTSGTNTNTTPISKDFRNGVAGGTGSAFSTIADFYIQMAKDLYPVIEIKGGREVQILVKGGIKVTEVPYEKMFLGTDFEMNSDAKFASIVY